MKIFKYILLLASIAVYVFIIISQSSLSYELKSLDQSLEVIKEANQELQAQVANQKSSDRILALAQSKGMIENDKLGILEISRDLALR